MRVTRLTPGWSTRRTPSRTRHLIGNLEVAPLQNGELQAKTAFLRTSRTWRRALAEIDHDGR
jgi:3-phenylpropionate/cinnamic acid dioxygenase small subunit